MCRDYFLGETIVGQCVASENTHETQFQRRVCRERVGLVSGLCRDCVGTVSGLGRDCVGTKKASGRNAPYCTLGWETRALAFGEDLFC